ncbi:MAG: ABC transporter substrate-binding protein, partial [Dehalococcoidia bacterium]|nr:ABC transporter substrate-binding protein [Dehalococcoidia bacterium]
MRAPAPVLVVVLALVVASVVACDVPTAPLPANDGPTPAIRVGYVANGVAAGVGLAMEETQALAARRVRAQVQRYGTVENLQYAVASGSVDVALGLSALAAAAIANGGRPVAIVAGVQVAEEQIVTSISSGVLTAADLRGRVIGAPPAESVEAAMLVALLANGWALSPADYHARPMTEVQRVAALQAGQVDAVVLRGLTVAGLPDPRAYRVIVSYPAEWRRATKVAAPPFSGVVVMQRALIDSDPDTATRVLEAIADAVRWG